MWIMECSELVCVCVSNSSAPTLDGTTQFSSLFGVCVCVYTYLLPVHICVEFKKKVLWYMYT